MTDTRTEKLAQASWRGVVFSVRSEDLPTGGRKTALHDYPNSDERFVEDLGKIPPRFTITAFVHGLDWIDRAQALENALNQPGPGRLVMPTFGAWTVWPLPYSKTASQTSVGEIEFNLEFATSRLSAGIRPDDPTVETIFAAGDMSRSAISVAFAKFMKAPLSSIGVSASLSDITAAANESFSAVSTILNATTLGELTGAVRSLLGGAGGLLDEPFQLALEFFGIAEEAPGIWQIISEGLEGIEGIGSLLSFAQGFGNNLALIQSDFDSGSTVSPVEVSLVNNSNNFVDSQSTNISLWDPTTEDRIDRNLNRVTIVESNRVAALVCAYEQAANTDYQTIEQIQTIRTDIEDVFVGMMQVDAQSVTSVLSTPEVRAAMNDLRIKTLAVLDQKAQSAWLTSQIIRAGSLTAPSLTYLLYAESITNDIDVRTSQVRQLNQQVSAVAMTGELTVLRGLNA